jgi:hypothetical protein
MNSPDRPKPLPPFPAYLDPVCARFEAACKSASSTDPLPRPEDYLGEAPYPDQTLLLQELVALELAYRRRRGEAVTAAAYRERFPNLDPAWLDREIQAAATAGPGATPLPSADGPPTGMTQDVLDFLAPPQGPGEIGRLGPYRIRRRWAGAAWASSSGRTTRSWSGRSRSNC